MLLNFIVAFIRICNPQLPTFETWAKLEGVSIEISKAIEVDTVKFAELVISYISSVLYIPVVLIKKISWSNALPLYALSLQICSPKKIPLLITIINKKKDKAVGWDYAGRDYIYWSHLLASEYGWTLEYIAKLNTNVALSLIQEILTDQQLSREFTWSTTEIAYPYNSTTKQSNFKPLQRPYWMWEKAEPLKKIRILKAHMPSGIIKNESGITKE